VESVVVKAWRNIDTTARHQLAGKDQWFVFSSVSLSVCVSVLLSVCVSVFILLDGFTVGAIDNIVQQVLVPRRIHHLPNKPLLAVEMVAPLANAEPVSLEEEQEFAKWFGKREKKEMK